MTGVGEALASAVVARVCLKLGNLLAQQLGPLWNLRDDMESMQSTMLTIQAVLSDAEKRSLRKEAESERLWLRKLKSTAHEIEDLLSDFNASIPPTMAGRSDKILQQVQLFCSSSNPVILNVTLAHKMKKITKMLDKIVSERRDFHFEENTDSNQLKGLELKDRETFSGIDLTQKNKVVGRDEEKDIIIKFLLQKDIGEDISIISIVGLGGLGKTTLAQSVYNDELIKKEFDKKAWVYVSMDFDLLNIGKSVLLQVGNGGQNHDNLQSVSTCLKSALSDDRFLIVLDDLWEEDGQKLERLYSMLTGGRPGSKVIVTTRKQRVAQSMLSTNAMVHKLEGLSDKDCWSIFSQRAFVSGNEGDHLVKIGKEIVKKCKGVPLAAVALGYILRSQKDIAAWSAVKNSEFWELEDDGVLSSLKLSYYHLPPQLRLCFTYCAIFPNGFNINKDKLIQQWIALGFIQETDRNLIPEKIGEEYVNILLGMSFLQYSANYEETQNLLIMHDLVHDLARSIVSDELFVLDGRMDISENRNPTNSYRHYSLLANCDKIEASQVCKVLPNKIRAIHFFNCTPMLFTDKIFSQKGSLHVLILSGCHVENVPNSVYHLKQLRYLEVSVQGAKLLHKSFYNMHNMETLNLSKSLLEELPISINKLEKLKNLCLHGCSLLRVLPESFCKLGFLTHLDLSDCCSLQLLPKSFGNLSRLHFLQLSGCSELKKLPESIIDLKHLTHLDISGCSSLNMLPEFLGNLSGLQLLYLSGCSKLKRLPESLGNIEGLQHLNLSDCRSLEELPESFGNLRNLNSLDLSGSEHPNLPQFLGNLENLEHLNLSHCYKLDELPECFGNLKSLRILNLSSCILLHNLPESFVSLQKLEKIDLFGCCNLEDFPDSIANSDKLQMLDLRGCSKLATTAENFAHSQEKYDIQQLFEIFECREIGQVGKKCSNIVRLKHLNQIQGKLHITCIENVHSSEEAERAKLCNKSKLHSLTLQWSTCELSKDTTKDELVLEKLQPHQNLELLKLDGYRGTRLPIWVMGLESSLPNLIQITLCNLPHCEQLPPFEHLANLKLLEIHNAFKIKRIKTEMQTSSGSLRKLKILSIRDLPDLEEWSMVGLSIGFKLERLEIYRCPRVIFRPCLPSAENSVIIDSSMSLSSVNMESLPSMSRISKMSIQSCSITSDEWGGLGHYFIKDLEIKSCKELYFLPEGISGLTSLKSLTINSCNNLSVLPEYFLPEGIVGLTSLESLTINDCNHLSTLPEWLGESTSLRSLSLSWCPNLKSLPLSILNRTVPLENLLVQHCSAELVDQCERVNESKIIHVCPRGLVSVVSRKELENYDIDDIFEAPSELLDSDAFGTTYKYQLEKGMALMMRKLRGMDITEEEFKIKMGILGAMKHPTLMPLCAYYYGEDEKLLVYDYTPIGSLSLWLHGMKDSGKSSLNWGARSRITLAVAQGLKYIHETSLQSWNIPGVVHGNIKSSNILLCGTNGSPDGAKIFNYGIAQIMGGRADDAYKAPELKDFRQVSQMSDVYSFGVLIMELLTGRNPKSTHIPGWVRQTFHGQWLDVELLREDQMAQQEMTKMMQLAMECVAYNPERRPTMEVVVHQIEVIVNNKG